MAAHGRKRPAHHVLAPPTRSGVKERVRPKLELSAQRGAVSLMGLPSLRTVDPGRERLYRLSCEDLVETAPLPGPGEGLRPRRVLSLEDWFISTAQCLPRSAVTGQTV